MKFTASMIDANLILDPELDRLMRESIEKAKRSYAIEYEAAVAAGITAIEGYMPPIPAGITGNLIEAVFPDGHSEIKWKGKAIVLVYPSYPYPKVVALF